MKQVQLKRLKQFIIVLYIKLDIPNICGSTLRLPINFTNKSGRELLKLLGCYGYAPCASSMVFLNQVNSLFVYLEARLDCVKYLTYAW